MWNHLCYKKVPFFIIDRLMRISAITNNNDSIWNDLIEACAYSKLRLPDIRFESEPFVYVDFESMRTGFLFSELGAANVYFIYRDTR